MSFFRLMKNVDVDESKELLHTNSNSLHIVQQIREGNQELREQLINSYKPFILRIVSRVTGKYVQPENSDEYSIALSAFNEAIDCYVHQKNKGFLNFAYVVVKKRVIDYIRHNAKHSKAVPFSFFEKDDGQDYNVNISAVYEIDIDKKIDIRDELKLFEQQLKSFKIDFKDLIAESPKHKDSKILAVRAARIIVNIDALYDKMLKYRTLPIKDILKSRELDVCRRTLERNRKYIIAVALILKSNMDNLKEYVFNVEREG